MIKLKIDKKLEYTRSTLTIMTITINFQNVVVAQSQKKIKKFLKK